MTQSAESVNSLRAALALAKIDLDGVAHRLEAEFAAQSSSGAPLHALLKRITRLEADVAQLEVDYGEVQTSKRELLGCSQTLISNWKLLQTLRIASGLPADDTSYVVEGLEGAVKAVRSELENRPVQSKGAPAADYFADP